MKHIVLLFGEDQFALKKTAKRWEAAFTEKFGDLNIDRLEGGKIKPNELVEAAQALPFLSEKRLIIVTDFLANQKADDQKKFADLLEQIPDSATVLLVEHKSPDKRTSLFKKLKKNARLEEFKPRSGDELTHWTIKEIETRGGKIDWRTATELTTLISSDSWKLNNEIEKLLTYSQGDPITRDIVEKLVSGSTNASIFKLTDALGQKRPKEAISIFHQLVEKGDPIPMVFSMLIRQIRMLTQIKELSEQGMPSPQIASTIKQHPYAVKQMVSQTRNFSLKELKNLFSKLVNIDLRLKTGGFSFSTNDQRAYMLEIEKFMVESANL